MAITIIVRRLSTTIALAALCPDGRATARAFDPVVEAQNFSKIEERQAIYNTAAYQLLLRQVSVQNRAAALAIQAPTPSATSPGHLCASGEDGCAGDVRLYDWQAKGYGIVQPVLFTARSGATISGRVWATRAGPSRRPGIVITNGSVQAGEQLYWFAAQTLAKAGYVVLTSDPQGQGQSDELGEAPDQTEGSPAQTDGRPFFEGTQDALDFFLSTPKRVYEPRPSCESGTSHAPKQARRVGAGLNAAYNPFWRMLNPSRVGLAGHSFGAAGVSFVGQKDPRVSAIVAWDNLGAPSTTGGLPVKPCPADPASHDPVPITKPALGMSADYGLTPTPYTSDPDPLAKSRQSLAYSAAGVDTGELIVRGGTHYEFSFIPNVGFPATLRGADAVAWYTTAWFDKYVKGDATADSDCSPIAGARTPRRRPSTPTTTATCSPSTTPHALTSGWPAAGASAARTCGRLCGPGHERRPVRRATRIWTSRPRRIPDPWSSRRGHAEDRRLDLPETFDVAAHPSGCVVEEEGLREAHDRVSERGRLDGRLIRRRPVPPLRSGRRSARPCAAERRLPPEVMIRSAASRSCSTNWRRAGASARLRFRRSNVSSSADPPPPLGSGPRGVDQRVGSGGRAPRRSVPSRDPNQR